jgi:DNA-binding transcriptional MerR regulator
MIQKAPLTLGAVARHFDCRTWQIRRLFERNLLPPAARVGPYRVIAAADLPLVEKALRAAGYLSNTANDEQEGQP